MRFYLMYGIQQNKNNSILLRPSRTREAANRFVGAYYYPDAPPFNKVKELKIKLRK